MVGGSILDPQAGADAKEVQNARALQVLARVKEKLTGRDFNTNAGYGANGMGSMASVGSMSSIPQTPNSDLNGLAGAQLSIDGNSSHRVNGTKGANMANGGGPTGDAGLVAVGGLQVGEQVDRLLRQATDVENLCQHYIGWCSFW